MTSLLDVPTKNTALSAVTTQLNGGKLQLRSGGAVLSELTLNSPAFAAPSGGLQNLSVTPAPSGSVTVSGTIDNFRFVTAGGTPVYSGTVGDVGSGADLELANRLVTLDTVITATSHGLTFA